MRKVLRKVLTAFYPDPLFGVELEYWRTYLLVIPYLFLLGAIFQLGLALGDPYWLINVVIFLFYAVLFLYLGRIVSRSNKRHAQFMQQLEDIQRSYTEQLNAFNRESTDEAP